MKRLVSPQRVTLIALAVIALGSTIGWVDAAGGSLESQGGATLSFSVSGTMHGNSGDITLVFFVEGPTGFYKQETISSEFLSGQGFFVTSNPITVAAAPAGVYEIGAEIETTNRAYFLASPLVSSSLGGSVMGTNFTAGENPGGGPFAPNSQGVSTFIYRNKLIPVPQG